MAKMANSVEQLGAFPTGAPEHGGQVGLSKREYFAGLAMQGMLAGPRIMPGDLRYKRTLEEIVLLADDLIKELEK